MHISSKTGNWIYAKLTDLSKNKKGPGMSDPGEEGQTMEKER